MATALPPAVAQRLAELAAATTVERRQAPALLDGYLEALLAVAVSGRRLTAEEERASRRLGAAAVEASVPLPALVDLYLSASRRLWSQLRELVPLVRGRPLRSAELIGIGDAVWRAADAALAAVSAGYVDAQRHVVRSEEAFRREFVDDLLLGRSSIGSLVERAERFGLVLGGAHLVVVASCDVPVTSGMAGAGWVEEELRSRTGSSGMLVEATDGHLVCVVSLPPDQDQATASGRLGNLVAGTAGPAVARITRGSEWRVGIGREHAGPRGVLRSYQEARDALDLARRLGWPGPVVRSRELLVYRVLLRDEPAIADLVRTVLGPLVTMRGGPEPWLRTLEDYFASGGNTAATARRLHLSVRAVSYRLARLADVTGYRAGDPTHQLPLLVAVTGARLLGWPGRVLSPE
jgi:sugar diacid utilization regulator